MTTPTTSTAEPDENTGLLSKHATKSTDSYLSGNALSNGTAVTIQDAEVGSQPVENETGDGDGDGEQVGDEENLGKRKSTRMGLLIPAVAIGILLSAADQTLVVTSYGVIGSDLNALNNTSWIATAYFLTLTSFQPLYGKLSDIFGRKAALLFAYTVFGIGGLFCGLARNLEELIAARAFQGIGGGGMTTVVSILLSDVVPLRERGTWQGYLNIVFATGASAGAPLGGILADSIGWRWAFLGQFPLCILASLSVYFVLHLPKLEDSHWREKLKKVDFLGAMTLITAVFALLLGLDRGSNFAWSDTLTIVYCCVSIPIFAIFIFVEMKVASHPFAPGHIIFERSLFASYLINFLAVGGYMGVTFYLPLVFQAVQGLSATGAGLRLIPPLIFSVSGSLFGGKVMQKTGKYYWLTISCLILCLIGNTIIFLCSGLVFDSSLGLLIGYCCTAFGGGSTITTTLINVIANADAKDQAVATACTYLFRSLGSVVGVSISASIVQQRLRTLLRESLKSGKEADEIVDKVRQSLDYIKKLEPHTRDIVRRCYQNATSASFGMSICFVAAALVTSCCIREKKLNR